MKNAVISPLPKLDVQEVVTDFPNEAELAAIRAWYAGLGSRETVARYLPQQKSAGQSARGMLGLIRRRLIRIAHQRHRADLAAVLDQPEGERTKHARAAVNAIEKLRSTPAPIPMITDDVGLWFAARSVNALYAKGIITLAELTVRVPRRRRWWTTVPGLGVTGARQIEAFFAAHPQLSDRARELVVQNTDQVLVPWELLKLPHEVDGSFGSFRAPKATCTLSADNDYEAVHAWLALHEAGATQRAYRKEAERLILWAIVERGRALSSLTTEDATAYRGFLRNPTPRSRWVGSSQARTSPEWRPFAGALSAQSAAYALTVIGAMFRWLIEQRYLLANPFAGLKVRESARSTAVDEGRVFSDGEWALIRAVANGLEYSYGWSTPAAQRLRFVLDFAYATGLRSSELVGAKLKQVELDDDGDQWLKLVGKGSKAEKVSLPPLSRVALDQYLMQRGLPTTPALWKPSTPLIAALEAGNDHGGITSTRLWSIVKRFFATAADVIEKDAAATAEKLRKASTHWMRHTHATHALARGADLTTVRDNLRHASVSTTSTYLHTDRTKRARQMREAFGSTNV